MGGLHLCISEDEVEARRADLEAVAREIGEPYPYEMLAPEQLRDYLPGVGPRVVGGSYSPLDGHISPLRLLKALHLAIRELGGTYLGGFHIDRLAARNGAFFATSGTRSAEGAKVVLAAGLGNRDLAPMVGLNAPVKPVRGQVLICERAQPFLPMPTLHVRQTGDGSYNFV